MWATKVKYSEPLEFLWLYVLIINPLSTLYALYVDQSWLGRKKKWQQQQFKARAFSHMQCIKHLCMKG